MTIQDLPTLNASLNAAAFVLMCGAFFAIKTRRIDLHRRLMLAAVVTSALFLCSYLTYHFFGESKKYTGQVPYFYYPMLISHVLLAAAVPVMVIMLLRRAFTGRIAKHKELARYAFPVWVYVSVTGVLIYYFVHT